MADKRPEKTENKTEVIVIPTAQRHKVLDDIATQLHGTEISEVVEVTGHKYTLKTLTSDEEIWADSYMNMSSPAAAVSSMRAPRLAASIQNIDGINVEEMFEFSKDADKADVEYHTQSQYRMRYWAMNQLMIWLSDRPKVLVDELWVSYVKLVERRNKSWDELKNSSARTLGGSLKASSSPVRESSPVTQTL